VKESDSFPLRQENSELKRSLAKITFKEDNLRYKKEGSNAQSHPVNDDNQYQPMFNTSNALYPASHGSRNRKSIYSNYLHLAF